MKWTLSAAFVVSCLLAVGRDAAACGGTFCDGRANAMPVEQKGENILFVEGGGHVEAHIQIQYQGDPERFAWVVPVEAVPDAIGVGSQGLFTNLLASTVPLYGLNVCRRALLNGGGGGLPAPSTAPPAAHVIFTATVGAFDVTVLSGRSGKEVSRWLVANGYQTIPAAPALLDGYAQRGFVFVAVKLTAGAGVDEIHPLVIRYPGTAPCIPLELTAVAAIDDMGVRAFFLGTTRVVPTRYRHVVMNPARIDWLGGAKNYTEVVSRAVDEAGGRAFVTEYAGRSSVVSSAGVYSPSWDANGFVGLPRDGVVDVLAKQGLAACTGGACTFSHPLVLPLLREHLPVPPGVDEQGYYSCLKCYPEAGDAGGWDDVGFARGFLERVVVPGRNAAAILQGHPYLTRLFTTISPGEMTEDPLFGDRAGLPDVAQFRQASPACGSGDGSVDLPDGRHVLPDDLGAWPVFGAEMPWAERVEDYSDPAAPRAITENSAAIDGAIAAWNLSRPPLSRQPIPSLGGFSIPPAGSPLPPAFGPATKLPPTEPGPAAAARGGCACRAARSGRPASTLGWLGVAALSALAHGRRRRTRS
jgi:MYXO-CTERM domain-containing protein